MYNKKFSQRSRLYGEMILALCVVTLMLHFINYESTTVPEWKIRVVNTQDDPVTRAEVYQTWKYYSLEPSDTFNRDVRVTDENGYVAFPQRTVKASLLRRVLAFVGEKVNINPHTSFGPHSHISLSQGGTTYAADYTEGQALPSEIIVQK